MACGGKAAFAILAIVLIALVTNSEQATTTRTATTRTATTRVPSTASRVSSTTTRPPITTTIRPSTTTQTAAAAQKCEGVADILLVLDCSSSIGPFNYQQQLNFSADVASSFHVGPNGVHFSAIVFSDNTYPIFSFTDYLTNADVANAIRNIPYYGGQTYTGTALNYARNFAFSAANNARTNLPRITIVITDGMSTDVTDTEEEAYLLQKSGIVVFAVGVGSAVDTRELNKIATYSNFVFLVNDFSVLSAIKSQLSTSVCEEQHNTTVFSCIGKNGCVGRANGNYRACDPECQDGYYYSCSNEYAYKMPCALGWYTAANGTRFNARLVYDDRSDTCALRANYCPRDPEQHKVDPPVQNNPTNNNGHSTCLGTRDSCVDRPDGNYAQCYPACQNGFYIACTNGEAKLMPCALGWYKDRRNNTYTDRMVYIPESDSCNLVSAACPRPTVDYHVNSSEEYQNGSSPDEVTPHCHGQADILYIVDSSGSIGSSNYQIMVFFLSQLTSYFTVGPLDVQFSLLIFSTDIYSVFTFNQYSNVNDIRAAVLTAPYLGMGTNTDLALAVAKAYSFSPLNGARSGVGRVAVVVTDGISNYPSQTAFQASLLKSIGVSVISVGVGPGADPDELLAIASYPELVFEVNNFNVLGEIRKALVTSACESGNNVDTRCISNSCIRRPNGNYPACNPECQEGYYYSCSNGYANKMSCPLSAYYFSNGTRFYAKLVYNKEKDECDYDVVSCPRNASDYAEVPPPGYGQEHNYNPVCISSLESCSGKRNGNYPKCYPDCQDGHFYSCSNNETYSRPCPDGWYTDKNNRSFTAKMIYNPTTDSCELEADYCPRKLNGNNTTTNPSQPTSAPPSVIPKCTAQADVLFILDASDSIGEVDFAIQIGFLANLTNSFQIDADSVHVSCIVFSTTAVIEFAFNASLDNHGVWQSILGLPYFAEGTDTASALRLATDVAFTPANGAREGVPRNAIVLTDGISRDPPATAQEADRLKRKGVNVYVVGIGSSVRQSELVAIASSPGHVFNVTNFDALGSIAAGLITSTCPGKEGEASCVSTDCGGRVDGTYEACGAPCRNGTYFQCANGYTYKRTCPVMWYQDTNGSYFLAPGVYEPSTKQCQSTSSSCFRNALDYKQRRK